MFVSRQYILSLLIIFLQCFDIDAQNNQCTPTAVATCGTFTCVQVNDNFFCLCNDLTLKPSASACNGAIVTTTTAAPVIIPNQCANAICPNGATCVPTNQNPSQYICLCPNNIIANPDCPSTQNPSNPCLTNNPCMNGATCVVNQLTLTAVCLCPPNTYGPNCGYSCRLRCDNSWCYNGGRCANAYGQPYCFCGSNFRGRRCELRNDRNNYVYLYRNPRP